MGNKKMETLEKVVGKFIALEDKEYEMEEELRDTLRYIESDEAKSRMQNNLEALIDGQRTGLIDRYKTEHEGDKDFATMCRWYADARRNGNDLMNIMKGIGLDVDKRLDIFEEYGISQFVVCERSSSTVEDVATILSRGYELAGAIDYVTFKSHYDGGNTIEKALYFVKSENVGR